MTCLLTWTKSRPLYEGPAGSAGSPLFERRAIIGVRWPWGPLLRPPPQREATCGSRTGHVSKQRDCESRKESRPESHGRTNPFPPAWGGPPGEPTKGGQGKGKTREGSTARRGVEDPAHGDHGGLALIALAPGEKVEVLLRGKILDVPVDAPGYVWVKTDNHGPLLVPTLTVTKVTPPMGPDREREPVGPEWVRRPPMRSLAPA